MTNRTEDLLRDTLEHRSATAPPLPDLMDAVVRRRAAGRRRNRVILTAAAVVLVVAGSITAAVTLTANRHNAAAPPPHQQKTRPTHSPSNQHLPGVPFAPIAPGPAAAYKPWPVTDKHTLMCTSADLRIHVIEQRTIGTATGMQLAAQSISRHTCRLDRNTIGLDMAASRAGPLLNAGEDGRIQPLWLGYIRVDPGAIVLLNAGWANWCGARPATAYPVVRTNQTISIRSIDPVIPPACTDPTRHSSTGIDIDTVAAPGSILTAAPTMHAPATVRAGTTLHYQLTLTNPGSLPITLRPCPSYTEEFGNLGDGRDPYRAAATYRLNCSVAPTIPAHAAVTFQMQIRIPAKDKGHTLTLGWYWRGGEHAVMPQGTAHQAEIRVLP